MASITRIMLRSFSTASASSISSTEFPLKPAFKDLFQERDLNTVVEKFKMWSKLPLFRDRPAFYDKTVSRLAYAKQYNLVEEILEDQKQYKDMSKEGFAMRLISLYGKAAMFDHAYKVFDEMPQRNCPQTVKSFNALLSACVNSKEFDKIDGLFRGLPGNIPSVKPNVVSYNTVIKGFCDSGSLDSAASVFDEIEKNGLEPDLFTFNTLLLGFYSNGRFLDGEKYWAKLMNTSLSPDIRSYNARLVGLVSEKKMAEAVELFNQLSAKKLKPDEFSHNAIINGFCNDGKLQEAKNWFSKLLQCYFAPNGATFAAVIRLACKMSDLDWASELFKQTFVKKCLLAPNVMQLVIDGLVKESKTEEAKQLLQFVEEKKFTYGKLNKFRRYNLTMPAAEESNAQETQISLDATT